MLSGLTWCFSKKAIGASCDCATVAGMLGRLFARRHTESLAYYKDDLAKLNWGLMLLGGLVVGSFVAAWLPVLRDVRMAGKDRR